MAAPKDVYFKAYDGTTLGGTVHSGGEARPTLIMTQGFSGLKDFFNKKWTALWQAEGFTVFWYDHRFWGASGGEPRNEVDPAMQTRDLFDAFSFAQTLPDVDPDNIFYWGNSMAAGNSIMAASINKAVAGVIAQQGKSELLPIFPETLEELESGTYMALFQTRESFEASKTFECQGHWEKKATFQSILNCMLHDPKAFIHRVSPVPLLMIATTQDVTSPVKMQVEAFDLAKEPKTLHVFEGYGHYDLWYGEALKRNFDVQLEWVKKSCRQKK
ncbi:uncharacterized protein DNG_04279 [Cephalotrichum gorgonifer]|uniref:Serine aminopeptidase S33 domain-containing protein n=1 Tax=Cephalotrichum gorgonifer TaxID=2041049 RepID=A0AAE8SV06_9PEZI|nr:uncharacterized protein DNG_04279 [Cephalotrichum gorgonifer]